MIPQRTPYNLCANATDDHSVCTTTLERAPKLLLNCQSPNCTAMATHCTLIRMPSRSVCFEHAQRAPCHSAFYAIPQHLLAMSLCCCGDDCDCTAHTSKFCIFLWCRGIAVRVLIWCDIIEMIAKRLACHMTYLFGFHL